MGSGLWALGGEFAHEGHEGGERAEARGAGEVKRKREWGGLCPAQTGTVAVTGGEGAMAD